MMKGFWDHLEDLRGVMLRIIVVWLLLATLYFISMPYIFDNIILAPCNNDFPLYKLLRYIGERLNISGSFFTEEFNITLINIALAAPFFIHISTAFYLSVVTTVPYLFYEVWRFLAPALYTHERRGIRFAFILGTVMFFVGVALGYFMVYPMALRFLASYQISSTIENTISLTSYIDNFITLIISMGIAFELPLMMWLLSILGVINRSMLTQYRRHAIVVVIIIAAIITPTGDPFTLSIVALPLYLLYELSVLMIRERRP